MLNAKVASIVVTFNPECAVLAQVLRALAATDVHLHVIVDNGSSNVEEVDRIIRQSGLPRVEYLPQSKNLGIAAAQNIGIAHATEAGCSHVILFDQDSQPSSDIVSTLLEDESMLIAAGVRVGAIGPNFRDPRSGSFYPQARIIGPMLKKVWINPGNGYPVEVSFIIASGSLIRVSILNMVGPMNEVYFIDKVDLEWCLRARAQGFSMFVSSRAVMTHSIGDCRVRSFRREISIHSPLRRYYIARNTVLLARQPWVPAGYRIRELFCVLARTPVFLFAVNFKWDYIKKIVIGILHGFMGRGGQYKE